MDPTYVSLTRKLPRQPSGVRDATIREALSNVKNKINHFQDEGLRQRNFVVGVVSTCGTMYILGAYPEWYWIFYLLKSLFLVFYKLLFFWYPKKQHYFFLDFCWITNGGFFFLFIALLLNICSPTVTQNLFLLFFSVSNGPLAWSVILLRNKLVFHNFEWSSTLFIHLSPAMASAGVHWNRDKVSETWGDRFENYTEIGGWELFTVGLSYYWLWWVLFTAWMLTRGLHYPEKGYETVYNALSKAHKFEDIKPFKGRSLRVQILIYMAFHGLGCTVGLAWSIACWYSYYFHAVFLSVCFFSAILQGSSWYLYAIQTAAIKQIEAMLEAEERASEDKGAVV